MRWLKNLLFVDEPFFFRIGGFNSKTTVTILKKVHQFYMRKTVSESVVTDELLFSSSFLYSKSGTPWIVITFAGEEVLRSSRTTLPYLQRKDWKLC